MDKQLLYQSIENIDADRGLTTRELELIAAEYPWFSTAQLLLSKRYHHQHDHRFSDQLFHTALVAGDRSVLYKLIHREELPAPVQVTVTAEAPSATMRTSALPMPSPSDGQLVSMKFHPIEPETTAQADASTLASAILEEESTIVEAPEVKEEYTPELLPLLKRAHVIDEETEVKNDSNKSTIEAATEQETKPPTKVADFDPLQRDILIEAVSSSIALEVSEDVGTASAEDETSADDSYAAWLAKRAKAIGFGDNSTASDSDTNEDLEADEDNVSEDESEPEIAEDETPANRPAAKLTPRKSHQQELIDRFIRFEPKIAPGKAAEYQPGNLAKESLEEDFSIVTETMAILFAKQGKLDKARKVYKQLMAEHPEKSVYFAAQLKNLDKYKKP